MKTNKKIGIEHYWKKMPVEHPRNRRFLLCRPQPSRVPLIELYLKQICVLRKEAYACLTALEKKSSNTQVFLTSDGRRIDAGRCQHFPSPRSEEFGTRRSWRTWTSFSNVRKVLNTKWSVKQKFAFRWYHSSETRRYDEGQQEHYHMRVKEGQRITVPNQTYHYLEISRWLDWGNAYIIAWVSKDRRARYSRRSLACLTYDANQLTATKVTSDFFEAAVA